MTLLVKTDGSMQLAPALRDAIRNVDPEIPVTTIQPLEQNISASLARRRFVLTLLAILGGLGAFLIAAGIYGLVTQSVNARVREFGVRAAVGAAPGGLVAMILREAVMLTIPGLAVGVALALAFARMMKSFVYQLSPADPISIVSAGVFLILVTFLSAWLPARRAAAVAPAMALRSE
jgi:ABC-type antimicrobial peptide transport system permease subunit